MKLQHLFTSATVLTLLLAGCSHNEKQNDSAKQEAKSKTDNKKSEHKSTSKKENEANKDEQQIEKAVSQLTINEKIALTMFAPEAKSTMVTSDELLQHYYIKPAPFQAEPIQTYQLNKALPDRIINIPQGVKFYEPVQGKGGGATLYGLAGNQIIITGTNYPVEYEKVLKEPFTYIFNIEDLYKQYGHNPNFKKVASLIKVSDSVRYPESDNASSPKEADSASSSTEQKHKIVNISKYTSFEKLNAEDTRTVLKLIEEYDGHPIDTNKYDVTVNKANHNDVAQVILKRKNSTRLDYEYTVYQDGQVFKLEYSE
ncbi:hypothetical protein [Staphylococcus simulans]|uniref:hypothetical protein n=1 Tax=Staphylococcus simulans TaxID=1286 RepID=UPI0021D2D391|nr:hypothetical protein [Staphylococcus simulans]UXR45186.1 hypothetical protein MUA54_12600 [Staphylococcus simulans]